MRNVTFYEVFWIMHLYFLYNTFSVDSVWSWIFAVLVFLLFPRWRIFWDSITTNIEYKKKHAQEAEDIETEIIKEQDER